MRLYVYVLQARGLPVDKNSDASCAKLQVGKHKSRTRAARVTSHGDASWNEEFVFRLEDDEAAEAELEIGVFDGRGYHGEGFLGAVRIPLRSSLGGGPQAMTPTWFPLRPKNDVGSKSMEKDSGKILLTITLHGRTNGHKASSPSESFFDWTSVGEQVDAAGGFSDVCSDASFPVTRVADRKASTSEQTHCVQALAGRFVQKLLNKNEESSTTNSSDGASLKPFSDFPVDEGNSERDISGIAFEEALQAIQAKDVTEMPDNLEGGILLDQTYGVDSKDLNFYLFEPDSRFRRDLAELEGTTDYHEEPWAWAWSCKDLMHLRRTVTYKKPATKLVKAVKATEEQTFLKADGGNFVVLARIVTPDVPCGNCFEVNLLYKIMPGPLASSGEACSHLVISWNVNFRQSTLMKGMIEASARQGLTESYEKFADFLAQNIKSAGLTDLRLGKEQLLAPLQLDHRSDPELAVEYFCNFTLLSFCLLGLYAIVHILLSKPSTIRGLEFNGIDLPDTLGELITSGILFLLGERVFNMISHFIQARIQRGSDHGVKAQGEGWLLTVCIMEGSNLPAAASNDLADPYVMFSCNGTVRTSSVQLQTCHPQWNEILEFDAMLEPPAVLDVEVFDFDGPFGMDASLGHAEINFLKHTSEELADMWVPLEGKQAQTSQSRLHLRIFIENTKGAQTIREYLMKMEKEVGKKLNLRSPHSNSAFQKLFGLPPEEFLINDFTCYLKRKMPLQGKLFLSARTLAFYANLFGHKTKFFFLWEDIEDIKVMPPSLATMGGPAFLITLKNGRGLDASHGAKSLDEDGRLKFQFQSFVSFNSASKTIMALWRARTLTFEQETKLEEDPTYQDGKAPQIENAESVLNCDDGNLSKVFSAAVNLPMELLMDVFDGGELEKKIMEKVGCIGYKATQWNSVGSDTNERHIKYKFNRHMSIFGGQVNSRQQKTPILDGDGWIIEEVVALRNVPFADNFQIHMRYNISPATCFMGCHSEVSVGVTWRKTNKFQKRITKNICDKLIHRSKLILDLAEREILSAKANTYGT